MRNISHALFLITLLGLAGICSANVLQDEREFKDPDGVYMMLLRGGWEPVSYRDGAGNMVVDIIFENRERGLLRVRPRYVDRDTTPQELAEREQNSSNRFRPGFTNPSIEPFNTSDYSGVVLTFDFTFGGRPKTARHYYLKTDEHTVHVLLFEGSPQVLRTMQNRTDLMARSFRVTR